MQSDFSFHQFLCLDDHQDSVPSPLQIGDTKQQGPLGPFSASRGLQDMDPGVLDLFKAVAVLWHPWVG